MRRNNKNVFIDYRLALNVSVKDSLIYRYLPTFARWLGKKPQTITAGIKIADHYFHRDSHVRIAVYNDPEDRNRHEVFEYLKDKKFSGYTVVWVDSNRQLIDQYRHFIFITSYLSLSSHFNHNEFIHIPEPDTSNRSVKADRNVV